MAAESRLRNLFLAAVGIACISVPSVLAQIDIQSPDGSVVKIGPGGVDIKSGNGEVVRMSPGAMNIRAGNASVVTLNNDLSVNNNGAVAVYQCANHNVAVNANNCVLKLAGNCRRVTVNGSNNKVDCDNLAVLTMNGSNNDVRWRAQKGPSITDNGAKNKAYRRTTDK